MQVARVASLMVEWFAALRRLEQECGRQENEKKAGERTLHELHEFTRRGGKLIRLGSRKLENEWAQMEFSIEFLYKN